jgi:hypothetical protein
VDPDAEPVEARHTKGHLMNSSRITRCTSAAVVTGALLVALAACGDEAAPPSRDVGTVVEDRPTALPRPVRTSERRLDFGDEVGTARLSERRRPSWTGSGNRVDFCDEGR